MRRLILNWYEAQTPQRRLENEFCLYKNLNSGLFGSFFFWCRSPLPAWVKTDKRVQVLESTAYPTFKDLIINGFDIRSLNVLCNTDIYFDNTLLLADNYHPGQVACISRWERHHRKWSLYQNHKVSQDTWIFKGRPTNEFSSKLNFRIGTLGCDNRIVHEVLAQGWQAINPALSIRTYHVHFSQQRYMSRSNTQDVVPPPYQRLPASGLLCQ